MKVFLLRDDKTGLFAGPGLRFGRRVKVWIKEAYLKCAMTNWKDSFGGSKQCPKTWTIIEFSKSGMKEYSAMPLFDRPAKR